MAEVLRCSDPWGRQVAVDADLWSRKVQAHPELAGQEDAIRQTIEHPELVNHDKAHQDRECFYRRAMLPPPAHRAYLKVVIRYSAERDSADYLGHFVSAHPSSRISPKEHRKWPQ